MKNISILKGGNREETSHNEDLNAGRGSKAGASASRGWLEGRARSPARPQAESELAESSRARDKQTVQRLWIMFSFGTFDGHFGELCPTAPTFTVAGSQRQRLEPV